MLMPPTNADGICSFCIREICESNQRWGDHQPSQVELDQAAHEGCVFCSTLASDIETHSLSGAAFEWPVHEWNLRRNAKIRESPTVITVTFRPKAVRNEEDEEVTTTLPERSFGFYNEDDLGTLPDVAKLGASTDSDHSWAQISEWMDDCVKNHPHCRQKDHKRPILPRRLIDTDGVNVHDSTGSILIVDTSENEIRGRYATLSHQWGVPPPGDPPFTILTRETKDRLMGSGLDWNDPGLAKNFRQAIIVARRLGVRYVWIDSLCIIQHDPGDSKLEIKRMHQVYRHAFCNIAAADARHGNGGLFRPRNIEADRYHTSLVPARYGPVVHDNCFQGNAWRVIPQDLWVARLLQNSLYSRGWVFQERMLAARMIHYSIGQIFWDCATISACEILPSGLPRPIDVAAATDRHWRERLQHGMFLKHRPLAGTADVSIEAFWKNSIRNYTGCSLTQAWKDKLGAIWGVAKLVWDALPASEFYGAGLWSSNLEEQLIWKVVDCRQATGKPSERPKPHRAPSWSWASMDGIIDVRSRLDPDPPRDFKVSNHEGGGITLPLKEVQYVRILAPQVQSPEQEYTSWEQGWKTVQEQRRGSSQKAKSMPALHREDSERLLKDDDPPELEGDGAIAMQGYLRRGHIERNHLSGKWSLRSTGHMSNQIPQEVLVEVFPDEHIEDQVDCHFVVLAYSKEVFEDTPWMSAKPTEFSGIGLTLQPSQHGNGKFERIGAFEFFGLSEAATDTLTRVQKPSTKDGRADGKDPIDKFWLV